MRPVLGTVRMNGVVVIGEGEKDEAPMLFNGEQVGDGSGPELDIAVDPVDGTTLTAKSLPDAISVLGVSKRGTMFDPGPAVYMQKLVVGAGVAGQVDLDAPIADTLATDRPDHRSPDSRPDRRAARPAPPPGAHRPDSRGRREDPIPPRRRRGRRHHGRDPRHRRRPARRHRRHAGGRARRLRAALPWRADPRPAHRPRR